MLWYHYQGQYEGYTCYGTIIKGSMRATHAMVPLSRAVRGLHMLWYHYQGQYEGYTCYGTIIKGSSTIIKGSMRAP